MGVSCLADRSVTVRLDADVRPFVTAMAKAEAAAKSLRDSLGKSASIQVTADTAAAAARIQDLQREVARLSGSSATVRADVDTAQAQAQVAELRSRLEELSSRKIGVDLDAGAAMSELSNIQGALQRLNATSADPKVRLDSAQALAELRTVQAEMSHVSGKSARVSVNADVGGALTAIALVGAALASLPAVTTIAVGVGALGGAFAAAGVGAAGFAAVAVPSLGRINDALKQQASAAGGAGGATKSAAQSAAEAASRALQLEQAERRVSDAQKAVKASQEDLTQARRDAKRALEDLTLSVKDAALAEEDAALSVEEARVRLAEVQADPKATELERQRAELTYREAVQRLEDQRVRTKRLQDDKSTADKKGVEGSDQVRSAQEKLLKSQQDLVEAQKQLTITQLQQKAAMEQSGGAAGGAAAKFAELSKAEQALAKDIKKFQDGYVEWQRSLQPAVFPAIRSGIDLLNTGMKLGTPLIKASAGAIDGFLKSANKELKSQQWKSFFDDLTVAAPIAIKGLGDSALNVATGLTGVVQAFLPFTGDLMNNLREITQRFEDWGKTLKGSPEFEAFIKYVQEQGPKVAEVLGNIATFVGKVFEVGAGAAPGVLDFLVSLSDKLASLDPGQIEAVAKGVGLIFAALKLGAVIKIGAFVALAEVLGKMSPGQITALATAIGLVVAAVKGYQIFTAVSDALGGFTGRMGKAGDAVGSAEGKFSKLGSVLKGAGIAAAVLAVGSAADTISDSISGLNVDVDKLSKSMVTFARDGQATPELLDLLEPKFSGVTARWETFGDSAKRLVDGNWFEQLGTQITGFLDSNIGTSLDNGKQSIDKLDAALATMVQSGNGAEAARTFTELAKRAQDAGVPVDRLKELFPQYASSLDGVTPSTAEVGKAIEILGGQANGTQQALGDFKASLDAFNSQTDVAKSARDLEQAFGDAKSAIEAAHGKMELTPDIVGRQRDAVITARDAFAGLVEKVRSSADAQGALARDTTTARDRVLEQLEPLMKLAGGNKSARDQVIELAKAYGISEDDAKKAAKGGQDLVEVLAKIKSKDIHVGADVKPAQEAIDNFVRLNSGRKIPISVYTKNSQLAAGGILQRYAAGGIRAMAGGGMSSAGPPAPNIASTPTVVYAEAGHPEAYVPFDPKYRDRAITILGQVADQFGLEVYNPKAQQKVTTLVSGLKATDTSISTSLDDATRQLNDTLGSTGTLTQAVGVVGGQMTAAWSAGAAAVSESVVGVSDQVGISSDMIVKSTDKVGAAALTVADVVAKAAQTILSAAKSSGGSSKSSSGGTGKGSAGSTNVPAPGSVAPGAAKPQNMIAGDYGLYGLQGNRDAALNYSRESRPQQQRPVVLSADSVASLEGVGAGTGSGGGSGGTSVNFYGTTIQDSMDADVVTAKIGMVLDSRG